MAFDFDSGQVFEHIRKKY